MRPATNDSKTLYGREGETVFREVRTGLPVAGDRRKRAAGRGRWMAAAVACVMALFAGAVGAAPALADWGIHSSFGGEDVNAEDPVGVSVAEASGDVYVGNFVTGNMGVFDASGQYLAPPSPIKGTGLFTESKFTGVAVNRSSGDISAVEAFKGAVLRFTPEGAEVGTSISLTGSHNDGDATDVQIAVDASGDVYVPNAPHNEIQVFDEAGKEVATITGAGTNALKKPEGVAIGPNGEVWVADTGDNRIEEFEPNGNFVEEIASTGARAVAVDNTGDVFASIGGTEPHVVEYRASTGSPISGVEEVGKGLLSESDEHTLNGLAFDAKREILYVANGGGNDVLRFTNWAAATQAPTGVGPGSATLNGTIEVEAGTSISGCRFEYGQTTAYGHAVPCERPGGGGGPFAASTSVSAHVSGLSGDTHYRIALTNAAGEYAKVGADREFGPPAVGSGFAEAEVTTATLRAHVTVLEAGESTCREAQYVTAAEYAASGFAHARAAVCITSIPSTVGEYSVETARISGLAPNTVYDYRFITESPHGTDVGPDETVATFGIAPESFAFGILEEAGKQFTQAGGRPYDLTDSFRLNVSTNQTGDVQAVDSNPKDVVTELPAGLIGNPDATPKCKPYDVAHAECSGATQVGTISVYTSSPEKVVAEHGEPYLSERKVPIYNLVPPKGLAAQFGARFNGFVTIHIDSRVRTGGDYGVSAEVIDSSTGEGLVGAEVTLWGVPAAESHDAERACPVPNKFNEVAPCSERGPMIPLLSNPTSCTGEREARMSVEPWQEDEPQVLVGASAKMPAITGCGHVRFAPSMSIEPTSSVSDSPTGLNVELTVPQNEDPNGLATADLKDAKVVLPAGLTVNPSSANGLAGCPLLSGAGGHPGVSGIDLENGEAADCPGASKVGTVKIKTPLLEEELEGGVYVAQQNANPFKSLLALYIAAEAPERGVVVKLAGHVELNALTGQLTTTFDENPQLPFEELKLRFFGGERATLATPRACGTYTTTTLLEPWSHQPAPGEAAGTPDASPESPFTISSGPEGSACGGSPFAPSFDAGTVSNQAAGYGTFTMTLQRKDGEQRLSTVDMTMPKGLAGMISKVTPCGEAQANAGTCPASAKIGHIVAQAGVGSEPITLPQPGRPEDPVYLTEKYGGAPFGLSIVVPAEAGPFNLGTVIVRARIEVNPTTAQVTVISNPMPSILQGIPLDVKAIHVSIDRPEFMFNATSCEPTSVSGAIGSQEGASADVASRYQAAGCAGLKFEPKFSALIHAHHSRKDGEYLHVAIASAFGQANIHQVHVTLPGKLPSRLDTLKHACTEQQFAANPAGCPAESIVGTAIAHTPILPVPMEGPAIFVSHAGKGFPNLDLLLQGDGINITLVGDTYINKKQVTTSTFKTVPDVPVSRFDLVLPAGPHSALAGVGNMCVKPLHMPVRITGQNGAVIKQDTRLKVTGCKPELHVVKTRRDGAKAKIVVQVPSAGRLVANGAGIGRVAKNTKAGKRVTLTVRLKRHVRRMLRRHHDRRLKVTVRLRFQPRHGKRIMSDVSVLLR